MVRYSRDAVRSSGVSATEIAVSISFNASSFFPMIARKRARLVWFAAEGFAATSWRSASSAPATSPLRPSAWAFNARAPSCCGLIVSAASTSSSSASMSPFTDFMPPRSKSASTFFGSFSSSAVTFSSEPS